MKSRNITIVAMVISIVTPVFARAEVFGLTDVLHNVYREILNPAIRFAFAAAVCYLVYGVLVFVWKKRQGVADIDNMGKRHMSWGVFGVFIMASAFGIIQFMTNTFDTARKLDIQNGQVVVPKDDGTTQNPDGSISFPVTQNSQTNPSLSQPSQTCPPGQQYVMTSDTDPLADIFDIPATTGGVTVTTVTGMQGSCQPITCSIGQTLYIPPVPTNTNDTFGGFPSPDQNSPQQVQGIESQCVPICSEGQQLVFPIMTGPTETLPSITTDGITIPVVTQITGSNPALSAPFCQPITGIPVIPPATSPQPVSTGKGWPDVPENIKNAGYDIHNKMSYILDGITSGVFNNQFYQLPSGYEEGPIMDNINNAIQVYTSSDLFSFGQGLAPYNFTNGTYTIVIGYRYIIVSDNTISVRMDYLSGQDRGSLGEQQPPAMFIPGDEMMYTITPQNGTAIHMSSYVDEIPDEPIERTDWDPKKEMFVTVTQTLQQNNHGLDIPVRTSINEYNEAIINSAYDMIIQFIGSIHRW